MLSHVATNFAAAAPAVPDAIPAPTPEALSRALLGSESSTHRRAFSLSSVAKKMIREIQEAWMVSACQPFRLASYLKAWRRRRLSDLAFSHVQLALGRRMYAAGIDDGESAVRMHSLDDPSRDGEATKPSSEAWDAERARLLLRLAASALVEEAPLPGADAEFRAARQAQTILRKHAAELVTAKALLIPQDKIGWCRMAIGYATLSCVLFLAVRFVWNLP